MTRPTSLAGRTLLSVALTTGLVLAGAFVAASTVSEFLAPAARMNAEAGGSWRGLLIAMSAGAVAMAILLTGIVAHSVGRPVRKLMIALQRSEQGGHLQPEFPVDSSVHDLNRLAEALNGAARSAHESRAELDRACLQFIETMAQALDARDPYTAGHSIRVGAYSRAIAMDLGFSEGEADTIRIAAQLHDIGKIGIADALLLKPEKLTPEEYGLIKLHPQIGRKILEKVGRFEEFLCVVESHHENYDGSGYPHGLKGDQTRLAARIVHVADAFDAMTTDRSFRVGLSLEAAVQELVTHAGSQFDPVVVEVFLKILAQGRQEEILVEAGQRAAIAPSISPADKPLLALVNALR